MRPIAREDSGADLCFHGLDSLLESSHRDVVQLEVPWAVSQKFLIGDLKWRHAHAALLELLGFSGIHREELAVHGEAGLPPRPTAGTEVAAKAAGLVEEDAERLEEELLDAKEAEAPEQERPHTREAMSGGEAAGDVLRTMHGNEGLMRPGIVQTRATKSGGEVAMAVRGMAAQVGAAAERLLVSPMGTTAAHRVAIEPEHLRCKRIPRAPAAAFATGDSW